MINQMYLTYQMSSSSTNKLTSSWHRMEHIKQQPCKSPVRVLCAEAALQCCKVQVHGKRMHRRRTTARRTTGNPRVRGLHPAGTARLVSTAARLPAAHLFWHCATRYRPYVNLDVRMSGRLVSYQSQLRLELQLQLLMQVSAT